MGEPKNQENKEDFVLLGKEVSEDTCQVLHCKPSTGTAELGYLSKLKDGQPLDGDIVKLSEREGPGYRMEYVYRHSSKGPSKVNSEKYKDGWENIWGDKVLN